eukprot:12873961-Alexandrium_andersonii.AAC.1
MRKIVSWCKYPAKRWMQQGARAAQCLALHLKLGRETASLHAAPADVARMITDLHSDTRYEHVCA